MFWAKRRFKWDEYRPYKQRMLELMMADLEHYDQFIMVSTDADASLADYYVGVPSDAFLTTFDGFEPVAESDVPTVIAAVNNEFTNRFEVRSP